MELKSTRYLDQQGRVIIPSYIRKALALHTGNCVEVTMSDDGTIRVRPTGERCSVCGEVMSKAAVAISTDAGTKRICAKCAEQISTARA